MQHIIDFIQSMEQSEGLKSSASAVNNIEVNFEAAKEMIEVLGGTLELKYFKPWMSPDEEQSALNLTMYINALIVRRFYLISQPRG